MNTLLFAVAVAATNAVTSTELPTIVVEASRLDNTPAEMASAVQVIDRKEIVSSGASDVVELLSKKAPSLHIRHVGAGNPALAEIAMRGYGENGHGRTLVLVDGEALNSPDMNAPNLSRIALGSIDRIEILSGSQCVLQGNGASSGIINIITEPSDYARKTSAELHVGSFGTVGGSIGTRGGIAEEGIKYWGDAGWDRSDGYRAQSRYDIYNLNAGLKKEWTNGTYLKFGGFFSDATYELPGPLTKREFDRDPQHSNAFNDNYRRTTYGLNTVLNAQINEENAIKLSGNFSNRKMDAYNDYGYGSNYTQEYDIYSYSLKAEWINQTELFGFENEFIAGTRYSYDRLNANSLYASPYYDSKTDAVYNRQLMDFFAADTFRFNEYLALQLGGRYSRSFAFNDQCEKTHRNDNVSAFDVALLVNPTEDSKLYAKWSRFYRNPFLDEVPYNPMTWAPARILNPEQGWNAEVGFDWSLTEEFKIGADAYYSWLEDEIFYDAVNGANVNSEDETVRRGFDVYAAWEREKLAGLSVSASYVKATFDGGQFGRNLIPFVPEMTLAVNGRVWIVDDAYLFGGYRFQSEMYSISDFNNDYDKVEWFGVFHLGVAYEPTFVAWTEGLKLTFTVDNLFDEKYCDYVTYGANYWPAAGRSYMFSIRYEF